MLYVKTENLNLLAHYVSNLFLSFQQFRSICSIKNFNKKQSFANTNKNFKTKFYVFLFTLFKENQALKGNYLQNKFV